MKREKPIPETPAEATTPQSQANEQSAPAAESTRFIPIHKRFPPAWRTARWRENEAARAEVIREWTVIWTFMKGVAALDPDLEAPAFFGLLRLAQFGDIDEGSTNWLGTFIFETLNDIALYGPEEMSADFERVADALRNSHKYVRSDVRKAMKIVEKFPTLVDEIKKEDLNHAR